MTVQLPLAASESRGWVRIPFPHPAWMSTRAAGDMRDAAKRERILGAFGALHSGWRGTGILSEGVRRMRERYGSAAEYRRWGSGAVVQRGDRPYLDMRSANRGIADRLGVGSVTVADHCTVQTPQLGSYRRDGPGYAGMLVIVGPRRSSRKEDHDEL